MTVEQSRVIDIISIDRKIGHVVLTVSDHLDWGDVSHHMRILQEKLNYYLAFVESGEILQSYPNAKGRRVVIEIAFKHSPVPEARKLLQTIGRIVEGAGFDFRYEHISIV
jgi:hypothetical protein